MKRLLLFLSVIILCLAFFSCTKSIDLQDYVIVISENANTTTKYASENLASLIEEKTGKKIEIVTDASAEREKEILIGETTRADSKTSVTLSKGQYLVFERNDKIVIKGDGIYVGAGCSDFANKYLLTDTSSSQIKLKDIPSSEKIFDYKAQDECKSVIFMIGDGMGENHIKMAEFCQMPTFIARQFPSIGTSITRSLSVIEGLASSTDSAASATAMSTGYKTLNDYIGVDKNGEVLKNVRELARENGAKTAVITTDLITGATPSAYLCHNISREDTEGLQAEIDRIIKEKEIDYIAGEVDNALTDKTKEALWQISSDGSQFFIMIEEAQIDKASHSKEEELAVEYVKRFNDAITYATQFALCHPDTALIVTADHETGNLGKINGAPCGYYFRSYAHTNLDTPIFAIGAGTQSLKESRVENIELAKICAKAYSGTPFGQERVEE